VTRRAEQAHRDLAAYRPADPEQQQAQRDFLAFLAADPSRLARDSGPEHLTASALVLDQDRRHALLTLHGKGGFWVQTGGHLDPGDAGLAAAALREAREESGIAQVRLLDPAVVDLDRHPLPGAFGACRVHWDVRFLAVAPAGAQERVSAESRDLRWFPLPALAGTTPEAPAAGGERGADEPGEVADHRRFASRAAGG
jgi:8-oxo-dGTP pyrophosphatase MutT (NUDIX family)